MADKEKEEEVIEAVPVAEPAAEVMPAQPMVAETPPPVESGAGSHGAVIAPTEEPSQPEEGIELADASEPEQADHVAPEPQPMTPQQEANERFSDDMKFAGDLGNGKIHPKTYGDLFNERSLPGKIGTVFGLLLSGIGSGMTHQPNAVMEMMNREIERDFEAQKQNQSNRQNWYKAAVEHERNKTLNALDLAHAAGVDMENLSKEQKALFDQWQNSQIGIQNTLGSAAGLNYTTMASLKQLENLIDNTTNPQTKQTLQQFYNQNVLPFFMQKIKDRTESAVAKKHLINAAVPNPVPNLPKKKTAEAPKYEQAPVANMAGIQKGILLGKISPFAKGAIRPEDADVINREIKDVEQIRRGGKRWEKAYNELASLKNSGESLIGLGSTLGADMLNSIPGVKGAEKGAGEMKSRFESRRNAIIKDLQAYLPAGTGEEREQLIEAYLPKWGDSDSNKKLKFENGAKHFTDLELTPTLDRYKQYKLAPQTYKFDKPGGKKTGKVEIKDGHVVGKSGKVYR